MKRRKKPRFLTDAYFAALTEELRQQADRIAEERRAISDGADPGTDR